MYKAPMEMPKYCSECPFGMCVYSYPLGTKGVEVNNIDGQKDEPNTAGYICTIEFSKKDNSGCKKVIRGKFPKPIKRRSWCPLVEVEE